MGAIMEAFHCDWGDKGGNAGKCWESWKCEPCCGEPCNPMDGIICFLCFAFCGLCSNAKLYAYSMDQDCGLVNHCLYGCFCGLCMSTCLRGNLRTMHDVGEPGVSRSIASWFSSADRALDASSSAPFRRRSGSGGTRLRSTRWFSPFSLCASKPGQCQLVVCGVYFRSKLVKRIYCEK